MRALALLLTTLTGFSGLVYEITWQKYLAILLGAHSEATAAILAIFLGGLSLGYHVFGRVAETLVERAVRAGRPPRLLLVYGAVEAAIGAYAFAFPLAFRAAQWVSVRLPGAESSLGFGFDVLLAALLIGPPTVLMGATIPLLTQALARGLDDATRFHALVYATNTAGAFIGALAAGFWLVPSLGLVRVLWAMGAINLLAGLCFVGLDRRPSVWAAAARAPGSRTVEGLPVYLGVALLTGFAMMTVQTALIRLGALAFGASYFTFSTVVAVFVLCIALGSFAVSALSRIAPAVLVANQWLLAASLAALYPLLEDSAYWAHALRSVFRDIDAAFLPYHFFAFLGILAAIGVPVALSGAVLPLIFHRLRHTAGDLGQVAGRLYGWNTVGSLLGALVGGYLLFFWLDLHAVYRVAVASLVIAAGALTATLPRLRRAVAVAAVVPALAGLALLQAWDPNRLAIGLFRQRSPVEGSFDGPDAMFARMPAVRLQTIRFYTDGPVASVAVREHPVGDAVSLSIINNGKSDGSLLVDYPTMALAGLIPALLCEKLERAFVIGYGTGVTTGELAALDDIQEVVVAEISGGVIEAAQYFEHGNQHALANPKTRIVRSDAYRALLRSHGDFDVIVSEPSNPWVTGVEMLFSREFLAAARDRLGPGGVYSQWFHTYEVDDETIELVLRTYADVFDRVAVWYVGSADVLLLGFASPDSSRDLERLHARFERADLRGGLGRAGVHGVLELLAHELLPSGVVHAAALEGPVHTLMHPILSHMAARAFFPGKSGELPPTARLETARIGARSSLLSRHLEARGAPLDDADHETLARHLCPERKRECVTLLAHWRHHFPDSEARERLLDRAVLDRELVEQVARLYDPAAEVPPEERSLAFARESSERFEEYYSHALPFRRAALLAAWARCPVATAAECARGRAEQERALGDLRVEATSPAG